MRVFVMWSLIVLRALRSARITTLTRNLATGTVFDEVHGGLLPR
jgi:hypothetical protein